MEKSNNLKKDILKYVDEDSQKYSAEQIITKDMIRVKNIKKATITSWAITVLLLIFAVLCEISGFHHLPDTVWKASIFVIFPTLVKVIKAMIFITVVLTIYFYVRLRTLSIKQINIRLARIEEHIKNIRN